MFLLRGRALHWAANETVGYDLGKSIMARVQKGFIRNELVLLMLTQALVAMLTIAVLFFPRAQFNASQQSQDASRLSELAADFHQQFNRWPKRNGGVWELAASGLIDFKSNRTDYQRMYENFAWNEETLKFEPK